MRAAAFWPLWLLSVLAALTSGFVLIRRRPSSGTVRIVLVLFFLFSLFMVFFGVPVIVLSGMN
jgi:hypothetical protein